MYVKLIKSSYAFILPAIINLLSLIIFTRILTLEDYGLISLAFITIELFHGLLYNWIQMAMVRFYKSNDKKLSVTAGLHYIFLVTFIFIITVIIFLFIINFNSKDENINFYLLIVFAVIGKGVLGFVQEYFRISRKTLKMYTVIAFGTNFFYYIPALCFLVIFRNSAINEILFIQVTGLFLFLLSIFFYYFKNLKLLNHILNRRVYKEIFSYGAPLIISFAFINAFVRVDRYIIQYNIGLEELGIYTAAFSLSNLAISSFFTMITLPTYPEIIRNINAGYIDQAKNIYKKNGEFIIFIGIPSVITGILFSDFLCRMFFGEIKGGKVATIFPWVILSVFVFNLKVHYFDQVFQFIKKTRISMIMNILIGIGHLILAYILCIALDAKGVAISSILLNTIGIVFIYYFVNYILKNEIGQKFLEYSVRF